jgi:D-glycero-D-manno-heptose 1,7-bisphosphate phosphatase
MNRAVFLDRDGTINEEAPYIAQIRDLHIYPFASAAIQQLNSAGFLVIIITNQSGVGRGLIPLARLTEIHAALRSELAAVHARIDAIYACTHTPEENCACRKPSPGLVLQAIADFAIDASRSFFVGDKREDILTARAVGITPILVRTGYGRDTQDLPDIQPILTVDTLADAAAAILAVPHA